MAELFKSFLEWLERVLPGLFTAFSIGFKIGKSDKEKIEKELLAANLELELEKNEKVIEKDFDDKSPADIIREIIRKQSDGEG